MVNDEKFLIFKNVFYVGEGEILLFENGLKVIFSEELSCFFYV